MRSANELRLLIGSLQQRQRRVRVNHRDAIRRRQQSHVQPDLGRLLLPVRWNPNGRWLLRLSLPVRRLHAVSTCLGRRRETQTLGRRQDQHQPKINL